MSTWPAQTGFDYKTNQHKIRNNFMPMYSGILVFRLVMVFVNSVSNIITFHLCTFATCKQIPLAHLTLSTACHAASCQCTVPNGLREAWTSLRYAAVGRRLPSHSSERGWGGDPTQMCLYIVPFTKQHKRALKQMTFSPSRRRMLITIAEKVSFTECGVNKKLVIIDSQVP